MECNVCLTLIWFYLFYNLGWQSINKYLWALGLFFNTAEGCELTDKQNPLLVEYEWYMRPFYRNNHCKDTYWSSSWLFVNSTVNGKDKAAKRLYIVIIWDIVLILQHSPIYLEQCNCSESLLLTTEMDT